MFEHIVVGAHCYNRSSARAARSSESVAAQFYISLLGLIQTERKSVFFGVLWPGQQRRRWHCRYSSGANFRIRAEFFLHRLLHSAPSPFVPRPNCLERPAGWCYHPLGKRPSHPVLLGSGDDGPARLPSPERPPRRNGGLLAVNPCGHNSWLHPPSPLHVITITTTSDWLSLLDYSDC
jgi:hypothetical protein